MNLKRPANDTNFLKRNDNEFMKNGRHQNHAKHLLLQKLKEREWSKEEFIEECRRKGFLKTPIDRQIVKDVLSKANLSSKRINLPEDEIVPIKLSREVENVTEVKKDHTNYKPL